MSSPTCMCGNCTEIPVWRVSYKEVDEDGFTYLICDVCDKHLPEVLEKKLENTVTHLIAYEP